MSGSSKFALIPSRPDAGTDKQTRNFYYIAVPPPGLLSPARGHQPATAGHSRRPQMPLALEGLGRLGTQQAGAGTASKGGRASAPSRRANIFSSLWARLLTRQAIATKPGRGPAGPHGLPTSLMAGAGPRYWRPACNACSQSSTRGSLRGDGDSQFRTAGAPWQSGCAKAPNGIYSPGACGRNLT